MFRITRGTFKFQIIQDRNKPVQLNGLSHTKQIKIRQGDNVVWIDQSKLDELIKTLKVCKKWLNSP